jgi:hypothetical protein
MRSISLFSISIYAILSASLLVNDASANKKLELTKARAEAALLKEEMQKLLSRIEALEKKAASIENTSSKEAAKAVEQKQNPVVLAGSEKVSLKISGQINRAMRMVKDGDRSRLQHVENSNNNSLLNVTADGKYNKNLAIGATWEGALYDNNSQDTSIGNTSGNKLDASTSIKSRLIEVFFKSDTFGKLSMGKGSMASDSSNSGCDLSGTGVVSDGSNFDATIGTVAFVNKNDKSRPYGASEVLDGFDGLGKLNRVRYDTPVFLNGFMLSSSHSSTNNDKVDFTLRYNANIKGTTVAAAISYHQNQAVAGVDASENKNFNPNRNHKQVNGALGLLFANGLNLYVALGQRIFDRNEFKNGNMISGKIGYQFKAFDIGKTSIAVDYGRWKNSTTPAVKALAQRFEPKAFGAYITQSIEKVGADVYFGIRQYRLSTHDVGGFNNILVAMLGAQVKF